MKRDSVGNLINISKGKKAKNVHAEYFEDASRYIQIEDLRTDDKLQYSSDTSGIFVNENDICIAWDGANAGTVGYGLTGLIGSTIARLRLKTDKVDEVVTPYLGRFLQSEFCYLNGKTTGATIPHIDRGRLEDLIVPLPPPTEQRRIAAILDKADAIRRKRQEALTLVDDLVKSQFIEMFGDPVTNPMGWKKVLLGALGEFKNGLNFNSREKGVSVHCLGVGEFQKNKYIKDISGLPQINLNSVPAEDYLLHDGDIVFVRSNGNKELVGRSLAVYPRAAQVTFSGFCIRFRLAVPSVNMAYLLQLLHDSAIRTRLLGGVRGANISNINQQILSALEIPVPPLSLQNQFAAFVEQADKSKFAMQRQLSEIETLSSALKQEFFA